MWSKLLQTLIKYLGLPLAKLLIIKLIEFWQKNNRKSFAKKELVKVKEAYELVISNKKKDKLEGVKKFENIFKDFT